MSHHNTTTHSTSGKGYTHVTTTICAVLCLDYVCLQWDTLGCRVRVCPWLHFEHNGSDDRNMLFRISKIQGSLQSLQTIWRWGGSRRRVKTPHVPPVPSIEH